MHGRLTIQLSDPAARTLGKPETHGKTRTQQPGSLQRLVRQSKVHYSKFSGQPRMDANARECGVNILIASDSRLLAFIRGFRLNNHAARAFAERPPTATN